MTINRRWEIRPARINDTAQIIEAIQLLLTELRGIPVILPLNSKTIINRLINRKIPGSIFIAETVERKKSCIGTITLSIQETIRLGGQYAIIQELWVHPNYRNVAIGTQLINAAEKFCKDHNLNAIEVCLPKKSFNEFEKIYHFYQKAGFIEIGPRMRK